MPDEPRSFYVKGAGVRLHLTDHGGPGPIILALHGVTGGGFLWSGVARELEGRGRVVALDFRGHGRSDWSRDRAYETAHHVTDLLLVLDQVDLGRRPPVIVGSSWGALVAIQLLAIRPDIADQLIIVDVEPSFQASEADVLPRPYRFASLNEALAWERAANRYAVETDLTAFTRASLVENGEGQWLRRHDPFFLTHWPFRKDNLWEELSGLCQNVKIIRGDQSFVRHEICQRMARLKEGWSFSEIASSGHLVPLEQPRQLAKEIADFIGVA
ncbi:alpha/beta fold hydrolase [Mesorhizobium sp. NPDC059054]|uniref:alpha/beta fold hydrolase n=1 Tax=Mesorhizobium sp. NPDC059054 TaxID=3346711 RepID=UPI00368A84B0